MTGAEFTSITATHAAMVATQAYRDTIGDAPEDETDPALATMRLRVAAIPGLGDAIKAAWLGAIDDSLSTTTDTFNAFEGTPS